MGMRGPRLRNPAGKARVRNRAARDRGRNRAAKIPGKSPVVGAIPSHQATEPIPEATEA